MKVTVTRIVPHAGNDWTAYYTVDESDVRSVSFWWSPDAACWADPPVLHRIAAQNAIRKQEALGQPTDAPWEFEL